MRYRVAAILLVASSAFLLWRVISHRPPPTPETPPDATSMARARELSTTPLESRAFEAHVEDKGPESENAPIRSNRSYIAPGSIEDGAPGPESVEAEAGLAPVTVLENLRGALRQYCSRFAGNPVGNNVEIAQALNGDNPRRVTFLQPEDGLRLNERGELVDAWGTAYFFHAVSRTQMEIRSAGPDRQMWTADDLLLK